MSGGPQFHFGTTGMSLEVSAFAVIDRISRLAQSCSDVRLSKIGCLRRLSSR